jgi:quercetin dioxygenase-like cupin family protein
MSKNKAMVSNSNNFSLNDVKAGNDTKMQVLISSEDAPSFAMRRFIMKPGGGMPRHKNSVEHEQFVLKGKAKIGIGEDVFEVKAGDVLFIPAGIPHWYQSIGTEPFEFLCMVPNLPDKIEIINE